MEIIPKRFEVGVLKYPIFFIKYLTPGLMDSMLAAV